ncbi:MAG TPA: autotransporter-associated beta strand repeat-containing protein [Planctomycetota bacterium]
MQGASNSARAFIAALLLGAAFFASHAQAGTTGTWTGAVSNNWNDARNWTGGFPNGNGDTAVFGPPGPTTPLTVNNDNNNFKLNYINFTGAGYTLTGNPINITNPGAGGGILMNCAGTNTIALNIDVSANNQIDFGVSNAAGVLKITGPITGNKDVGFYGGATPGRIELSGNNNYSSTTTIDTGVTLALYSSSALGTTVSGTTLNSGSIALNNNITVAEPINLNGAGVGGRGAIYNESGSNTYSGAITVQSATTIGAQAGTLTVSSALNNAGFPLTFTGAAGATITASNVISGTGTLTKTGADVLVFTGANTYSGITTISAGTLQVGNAGTTGTLGTGNVTDNALLLFNRSNALTVGNTISGTGALTQAGAGTLTLSAANTYSGATTISTGTLTLGIANGIGSSSAVTVTGGAVFNLAGFSDAIGSLAGAGNVTLGAGTLSAGNDNTSTTYSGIMSGGGGLTKTGTGTMTLSGNNSYTGTTTVSAGTLIVNGTQGSSAVSLNGGVLEGVGTVGSITSTATGGTVYPGPGTSTLHSGNVTLNAATTFTVDLNGNAVGNLATGAATTINLANATLNLNVISPPTVGTTMTLINNGGAGAVTGTFNGLAEGSTYWLGGVPYSVSYIGGDGNDVTLTRQVSITARQTVDSDFDGYIDAIRIVTDAPLNDNFAGVNISVAGYTVTGYDTGGTANDNEFFIRLTEKAAWDTDATPAVQVLNSGSLHMQGASAKLALDAAPGVNATDKAKPVLVQSMWNPSAGGVEANDSITLTFSEPVTVISNRLATDVLALPVTGDAFGAGAFISQMLVPAATTNVTLMGNPLLSPGGLYSPAFTTAGSPSGLYTITYNPSGTDSTGNAYIVDGAGNNLLATNSFNKAIDLGPGTAVVSMAWDDLTITPKTWNVIDDFGITRQTNTDVPAVSLIARNTGNVRINVAVSCTAASAPSGWNLASTSALNAFEMKLLVGGFPLDLATGSKSLVTAMYSGHQQPFDLRMVTPADATAGVGTAQTITITLTASQN